MGLRGQPQERRRLQREQDAGRAGVQECLNVKSAFHRLRILIAKRQIPKDAWLIECRRLNARDVSGERARAGENPGDSRGNSAASPLAARGQRNSGPVIGFMPMKMAS